TEQFNDIMRSLRFTLRSDLLEINHQLKIKKVFDAEITELQGLIKGMDEELKAGNIALKDNLRLKALLFNLQNELVNIESTIMPVESELKLLLQSGENNFIAPKTDYQFGALTTEAIPALDSLVKSALNNRPDAKIARVSSDFQYHQLIYQKALAKPDVTIGTEYDQRSSYNPNYVGLSVGLPINIFNRNQGNIKSVQYSIKQQEAMNSFIFSRIENEVNASFNKLKYFQLVNNLQQLDFSKKYDDLFQHMLKTYQARQISLLEFLDFTDAYKDTKLKLLEQHNSLVKAIEELNYTTNSTIINIY
ncbi:MAG: TolC family protein, partial [Ferruginibacter sp.]